MKYIYTFITIIFGLGILYLSIAAYNFTQQIEKECIKRVNLYSSNTPNYIDHLGTPLESICIEYKKD